MNRISALPEHSRVWIYQCTKPFDEQTESAIQAQLQAFVSSWSSHGTELMCAGEIAHHQFIVLAVDENIHGASGCSIDKSVHFIQGLEKDFGLSLMDRMKVVFLKNDQITTVALHDFWAMRKANLVDENTIVFDNLVENVGQWKSAWQKKFGESWHQEMWR